ncbi:MAG: hypothetical protein ACFE9L_19245 [Candidatus Hodarchaeota archaeon]
MLKSMVCLTCGVITTGHSFACSRCGSPLLARPLSSDQLELEIYQLYLTEVDKFLSKFAISSL